MAARSGGAAQARPTPNPSAPPDWLGLSDEAAAMWKRLAADLPPGAITAADAAPFGMWCTAVATWTEMNDLVKKFGALIPGDFGGPVQHPAGVLRDKAAAEAARWAAYFKATPKDRRQSPDPAPGGGHILHFPRLVEQ